MTIYEANRRKEIIENELKYLYEKKQLAFESTQPKGTLIKDMVVQSSHISDNYRILDYSIDEIEPRIKELEKELMILKKFINGYYEVLDKYEPIHRKIIQLREEHKMTWQKIADNCNYSERQCINIYNKYKEVK